MPIDLNARTPVDFRSGGYAALFHKLQGNIVKGHGRDHAVNLFVEFSSEGDALRRVLRGLTTRYVTSAYRQLIEREQLKQFGIPGALFGSLFLTRHAYRKLQVGDVLDRWFSDPPRGPVPLPQRANFLSGMHAAAADLDDVLPPGCVDPLAQAYQAERIDALLLLADDSASLLLREARHVVDWLERRAAARVLAVEIGHVLRNEAGAGIEPFGYVDGLSQPVFLQADASHARDAFSHWDPLEPLSLVLKRDPGVPQDDEAYGSYFVFRKLQQDVDGFRAAEARLADALHIDVPRAGAMLIGRFRDGTPLALSHRSGFEPRMANDFRYDGLDTRLEAAPGAASDRFGLKCPFQAHIRKTNPRQSNPAGTADPATVQLLEQQHRSHRIVRRGIPYAARQPGGNGRHDRGVGMLFACYQSSIIDQFAFMQSRWANSSLFPIGGSTLTGLDPLIGQDARSNPPPQFWRHEYGGTLQREPADIRDLDLAESHRTTFGFHGFVRFLGGEFFFAPSLPFLLQQSR